MRERLDRLPPVGTALDLGCGWGRDLVYLATRERVERGLGVDLSPGAIEGATALATAHSVHALDFRRCAIEQLGLGATFDLVLSISSLNYIDDLDALFDQLRTRCRTGSQVLIAEQRCTHSVSSGGRGFLRRALRRPSGGVELLVPRDASEVIDAALRHSFSVVWMDHAGFALNRVLGRVLFRLWKRRWRSTTLRRLAVFAYTAGAAAVRLEDRARRRSARGVYWFLLLERDASGAEE